MQYKVKMKLSNQASAVLLVLAAPLTSNASCVQEKVDNWVALNNTLYQDLTCNCTMGSDAYKAAAAACSSEIDKYTAAAEASCQLEKEYDSPQNYGDWWLQVSVILFSYNTTNQTTHSYDSLWRQVVQPYKFMSAPDTNGAPFLDGKYDLATMFGSTGVFTVLDPMGYPTPEVYKNFCFANMYTGQKLDEEPISLFPTWTLPAGKITYVSVVVHIACT